VLIPAPCRDRHDHAGVFARRAQEVGERVERSLDLAVRPERIRLPRQACDLGQ
jgi:hypothetical protein